ncbi:MAG: imidazolonepropionase [Clostridia bacterium]|nr:imidazolonepropionase [Clostridia bacterium]
MTKRNYTHVKELLPAILKMVEQGKTQREIAEHYGLKDKLVVKRLLERERRKERNQRTSRGRKPAKTLQEYKYENKRLKMEVELLRDFLSRTEGM